VSALGTNAQSSVDRPCDQEEVLGELRQMVRLLGRGDQGLSHLGAVTAPAQCGFELGLEHRERGPQFVAGVGHETALAREGRLEPREHVVQGLAEPPYLVAGGGEGKAFVLTVERDPLGPSANRFHRSQPGGRQPIADDRGQQDRHGTADRE